MGFWAVFIELFKSFKEFSTHVIRSETIPLDGKANLIALFVFGLAILLNTIQQFIKDVSIPLTSYLFFAVGMMSLMNSGTSLEKIKSNELKDKINK